MDYFFTALLSAFELIYQLDQEVFIVVWTSLKISILAVALASLLGIPLGFLVALTTFRGKSLLMQLLNSLVALPTVVIGLLFYGMFSRQGPLGDLGLLYTPLAMVIGQCVLIIPIIWNLSISAASGADPRLKYTCLAIGADRIQSGVLYFNEVRFAVMAAVVMGFGRAIGEIGIAMMLGGNIEGFTRTMTTAIALESSKGEFEFALALGIILLIVAFVVNGLLEQFQRLNK